MFHRPRTEIIKEPVQQKAVQQTVAKTEQKEDVAPILREAAVARTAEIKQEAQAPVSAPTPAPVQVQAKEEKVMINDHSDRDSDYRSSMEPPAGAPFQRPPQMQRSVPGGFPGAYAAPVSHSPFESRNESRGSVSSDERRLVIGQGITMSGEIESCDYLMVEGTLEAALKGAKILDIAACGTFYGSVEIEEATVAGRFEGELTVNGRLTIKSGGSVTGSISYKELSVEAGATLDGKVSPLASAGVAKMEASKKSMAPKNDNAGRMMDSSELPFSGRTAAAAE